VGSRVASLPENTPENEEKELAPYHGQSGMSSTSLVLNEVLQFRQVLYLRMNPALRSVLRVSKSRHSHWGQTSPFFSP